MPARRIVTACLFVILAAVLAEWARGYRRSDRVAYTRVHMSDAAKAKASRLRIEHIELEIGRGRLLLFALKNQFTPGLIPESGWSFSSASRAGYPLLPRMRNEPERGAWGWVWVHKSTEDPPFNLSYAGVVIPFWSITFGSLVLFFVTARFAGPPRRGSGWCDRCGYDLRATPGRCPECGHFPQGTTA